ncbi:MAG: hypothetical protein ACK4IS_07885 [Erythrobacter sp.]
MSALPPDDMRNLRQTAFAARHPVDAMIARWQAIGSDAARLAGLAAVGRRPVIEDVSEFASALERASDWQRELAWQGVEDISAMLQAGMAALDVLAGRGIDPQVPALALWREVDAAQAGLRAMLSPSASSETASSAPA